MIMMITTRRATRWLLPIVAVLALLGALAVAAPAVAAQDDAVYPVDENHPLTESSSIEAFEADGVASGNLSGIDATLTVAEQHDDVDLSGYYTDINRVYACVEYREGISRTLRVTLPGDYIRPRPGESESLTSSHTARYAQTGNDSMSIMIRFTEPGRACIPFTKAPGYYFEVREDVNRWVNDSMGIDLPGGGSTDHWKQLPPTAFENSTTYEIDTRGEDMTVQFDADPSQSTRWLHVPDCNNPGEQEVCKYREDPTAANTTGASNASLVVMSTAASPPPVRYRYGQESSEGLAAGLRDIQHAAESFIDDVGESLGSLFGGGS